MPPAENFATSIAGIVDTRGKFSIGVNDTGGKFFPFAISSNNTCGAPWAANISAIFEKIWNSHKDILRGLAKTDSWKKPEVDNLVALTL